MRKFIFASALALAFVASSASAASITNIEFSNGDVTIDGKGGTTTNVELRIVVGPGEVVEYIQTDVDGDMLGPVDHKVGGTLGLQENTHYVKVPVKFPPNTGTYDLDVQTAGIFGGIRSINGDDNVNGSDTFSGALRVVANATTNDDDEVGGDEPLTGLAALIAQIEALVAKLTTPTPAPTPTPTKPAYCASLALYATTGKYSSTTEINGLQNLLVTNGFMSQSGYMTGPGIYGPRTTNAHMLAKAQCA